MPELESVALSFDSGTWLLVNNYLELGLWFACELLFYVYFHYRLAQCQALTKPASFPSSLRRNLISKILDVLTPEQGPIFISKWFFGAEPGLIWRGNMEEWLAWVRMTTLFLCDL